MKKFFVLCATLLCAAVMTAGEAAVVTPQTEGGITMEPKILVVYFSRTGNTEKVGQALAAELKADTVKLSEQGTDWEGVWGYLKAGKAAWKGEATSIEKLKKEPKDYDLVVVGTPIWAWDLTPAVRSFLTAYKDDLKKVAFFATEAGSGHEKAFKNMETLTGKAPVATAFVLQKECADPAQIAEKVAPFAAAIKKALGAAK